MRRITLILIAAVFIFLTVPATESYASTSNSWLDTSGISRGIISISYKIKNIKIKVMITKGKESYTYNLLSGKDSEQFPLQFGNGEYTISLLENTSGKSYRVLEQNKLQLKLKDENVIYLNSVQNISWTSTDKAITKAKELVKGKKTVEEKVKSIYDFITANIAYDNNLAKTVPTDYLPDIERTLSTKKDICYGYSSLFAAMLRSLNIPTKLVMGSTEYVDVYHAWNEVYLEDKWVTIDTTLDAGTRQSKKNPKMIKDNNRYTKLKQY
ncbi:transglutaminase domain-containing protein [Paenibacillus sp. 1011MAR3C5]|uniref:transglutaminase-like domain-containing protein n=1 Tax=Paenibacillus sp. 1011MAR3C5 TaxID=1675787 RepID=UPI000E6CCEEC|nr:transglutaminase-like domain-containing protein [Paenibacillus sp. 1011MAR3C5]RJE83629.1 transglutaminase domain-containing protein [Paenibacillus sp. 1011MAR3C5]